MPSRPSETDLHALLPWHEPGASGAISAHDDLGGARQWLEPSLGNDAAMARLRLTALALADGTDLSRIDDHRLVDHLAATAAAGRLRIAGAAPRLLRLVPAPAPAAAPAAPPAGAPRAAPVAAPPAAETTFGSDLDVAAQVAVLQQASRDGVPFCEECAKAAARAAAEAAA
jgi:hypothetical protein